MSVQIRSKKNLIGEVKLTPSKSISNRVLLIDALSHKKNKIENLSSSTDTQILKNILSNPPVHCDAGDAGTAFRFLTAYLAIRPGEYVLTGSDRMKFRPCGPLVDALNKLGANIKYTEHQGYPPLEIHGTTLEGSSVAIDANISSQFITALLLIAPELKNGLKLELTGKIVSQSYLDLTIDVMSKFGAEVSQTGNVYTVAHKPYKQSEYHIENDWSSAGYWYLYAACAKKCDLVLRGIDLNSRQGDAVIAKLAESFGVFSTPVEGGVRINKKEVELPVFFPYDFTDCPDLVMTMAVLCAINRIQASFTGVKNLRIKESNRLVALQKELGKFGVDVHIFEDELRIDPADELLHPIVISGHNDHRMVMAFTAFSYLYDDIVIDDPAAVRKSYPEFWDELRRIGFEVE